MVRLFATRRPNRASYIRFIKDLEEADIPGEEAEALFRAQVKHVLLDWQWVRDPELSDLHIASRDEWVRMNYPSLYICPRCHKTGKIEIKHERRSMCKWCAQGVSKKYQPRYVDLELEPEEYTRRIEETKARRKFMQTEIMDLLTAGKVTERRSPFSVQDILDKASGKANGQDESQHDSPLDVSKTEGSTDVQPKPDSDKE